jgi:hypothetical protein
VNRRAGGWARGCRPGCLSNFSGGIADLSNEDQKSRFVGCASILIVENTRAMEDADLHAITLLDA